MLYELYKKSAEKNKECKIEKDYLSNAKCMIYKKLFEESEILKEKTYRKNFHR